MELIRKLDKRFKHGEGFGTELYSVWAAMKQRCFNARHEAFKNYGGGGITICPEWTNKENGYINFRDWSLSNGYQEGLEIDRIDNNSNYVPSNCRWVTNIENQRNRRDIKLTLKIVEEIIEKYLTNKYTQYELAKEFNVDPSCISRVLNKKRWNTV